MRRQVRVLLSVMLSLSLALGPVPFPGNLLPGDPGDKLQTVQSAAAATQEPTETLVPDTGGVFYYTRDDKKPNDVTITQFEGDVDNGNLDIAGPFKDKGLNVVEIGYSAFENSTRISSVTIPKEVITIGQDAFRGSTLSSVTFEKDEEGMCALQTIQCGAFAETALTKISIPGSVVSIGATGPDRFDVGTFYNCTSLAEVIFEDGDEPLSLYSANGQGGAYVGDFNHCAGLKKLEFPDRVSVIPAMECHYAESLSSLQLPKKLGSIGRDAFSHTKLSSVDFPDTLESIEDSAFQSTLFSQVKFPDGLKTIDQEAFYGCRLMDVTFPANLQTIGNSAFYNNQLVSATFLGEPDSVSDSAFDANKNLTVYAYYDKSQNVITACDSGEYKFNYLAKSIAIKEVPNKTQYIYGETKELQTEGLELTVQALHSDGTNTTEITRKQAADIASCSFTGYDANSAGPQEITVAYGKQTAQFKVSVRYDLSKARSTVKGTYTYTGRPIVPEVEVTYDSGKKTVQPSHYQVTASNNKDAGTQASYKVEHVNEDYTIGECSGKFTINRKSLADPDISVVVDPESMTYTGKELIPKVTVTYQQDEGDLVLAQGEDYTLEYTSATFGEEPTKNVGKVNITIKGIGNYTDSIQAAYSIDALDISSEDAAISVADIPDQTYTGDPITPNVKVQRTMDGVKTSLRNGIDYDVSYARHQAAGTATVTIAGKGNYTGSITKNFTINPVQIDSEDVVIPELEDCLYNGKEIKPQLSVNWMKSVWEQETLTEGEDYSCRFSGSAVDASGKITGYGEVTVTIEGKGNFAGTVTRVFHVNVSMEDVTVQDIPAQTYTGTEAAPEFQVSFADYILVQGVDYTVSYRNNINAGTAGIILTGAGYFQGTKEAPFTIEPADIASGMIDSIPEQVTATGQAIYPQIRVTAGGRELLSGIDYTVDYENNEMPGIGKVIVTGIGNYQGTLSAEFTIKPVPASETVPSAEPWDTDQPSQPGDSGQPDEPDQPSQPPQTVQPPQPSQQPAQPSENQLLQNTPEPSLDMEDDAEDEEDDEDEDTSSKRQTIKVKVVKKTVKAAQLKRKAVTFSIKASAKGKLTCRKVSGSRELSISKTGKVKVKKRTKKGIYKMKVKITAAARSGYSKAAVTKTIQVICK